MSLQRILLVEDDRSTREHLLAALSAQEDFRVCNACATLEEARRHLDDDVDVLLSDLGLPDGSGIDLIREVTAKKPAVLVMVLTVFGDERTVLAAIEAGATGYLLKTASPVDISVAVHELVGGGSPISPAIARHLLRRYQSAPAPVAMVTALPGAAGKNPLTAREIDILRAVAKGFSAAEVGRLLSLSTHTVTTHVRNIYRKLEVSSRSSAIYEAVNSGWLKFDD
jgi:DNA-binding NarL/FixJ family response regulator